MAAFREAGLSPKLLSVAPFATLLMTSPVLGQAKVATTTDAPLPRAQFIAGMDGEFRKMDADKNGQLSQSEFEKIATPAPVANAQPMIARMDGNRDSQISGAEYRTATLANFDRVDSDRNGIVTTEELKAGGVKPR